LRVFFRKNNNLEEKLEIMMDNLIYAQIKSLPENLKIEVLDFIGYLIAKYQVVQNENSFFFLEQVIDNEFDTNINQMKRANVDSLFMSDLYEVNSDFELVNAENLE
jgi:hypothetical protein